MNNITQHYIIDMSSNNNYVQVPVMQGDGNDTRIIEIELQQNGVPYAVDSATNMVTIMGTKPDGTEIWDTCTIDSHGYIIVNITYQMATVPGRSVYTIALFEVEHNRCLKSFPFFLMVTRASYDPDYIMSSNEFEVLVEAITAAQRAASAAEESAEEAAESAATSTQQAQIATQEASTATSAASIATSAATTATQKASEAEIYADNASVSESNAATSATNSENSAKLSKSYAVGGTGVRPGEDTDNSKYYYQEIMTNIGTAVQKAAEAASSASAAATSETNAANSATAAAGSASDAATSATNAAISASNAAISETNAMASESQASDYAADAMASETAAAISEAQAAQYAADAQAAAQSIGGGLIPMGTVTFANLPSVGTASVGEMYEVSDAFTTTADFEVGAGVSVPAGATVYKTNNGKWAIKTPSIVQGVKGDAEANYRQGNINITAADIGVQRIFYVNAEPTGNVGDIWIG